MKTPDLPPDESSRINSLHSLKILDTPPEERFDRLTRLARRLFNVPMALVSLVDTNRQWFKSHMGLDISETERRVSFCAHAILANEVFIINDATRDERFVDNPLVINDPHIRFYAGCPLKASDGNNLGTLCILDSEPRTLSVEDIQALQDLASLAERELAAVQLATLDELTKISNRRGFITLAQTSLDFCARKAIPASLVFLDLNKFKPINDKFGHAEGDKALVTFAEMMKNTFRDSDVFARLGGDEFVVLLTDSTMKAAEDAITRFRQAMDKHNLTANCGYDILFSEGIVNIDHETERSIASILNRADTLMYANKIAQSHYRN